MRILKTSLIAGGLSFLVNLPFILIFMATGITYQWFFVWPVFDLAYHIETTWLSLSLMYAAAFLEFFVPFWIVIWLKYGRRAT